MKIARRLSLIASVSALALVPTAATASARSARHLVPTSRPGFKLIKRERDPASTPTTGLRRAAAFASAATASVPPVNYSDTPNGPGGSVNGTVECEYVTGTYEIYSYPPVNVYDYPGAARITWAARPEEWNGNEWVLLNPTQTFLAGSHYAMGNNWMFFAGTRGWSNLATGGAAPSTWSVVHGHYYASQDITRWYNAAGQLMYTYTNYTNYCEA